MNRPTTLLASVVAALALAPAAPALAAGESGGAVVAGESGGAATGVSPSTPEPTPEESRPARKRVAQKPAAGGARLRGATLLTSFELRRKHLFLLGRAARVNFPVSGRRVAKVRLHVRSAADRSRLATIDLGERGPGSHSVPFTGLETGTALAEGSYLLHIAGRRLRRAPGAVSTAELEYRHHTFPIAGVFDWGGEGSRFGAPRKKHTHQGQDLAAAEGTPLVAPRGGVVEVVQYQAAGAGHYVVLDGDGEDHDYVFMHMREGSVAVKPGQRVRTGQLIGQVGNTGASSGPHLHFEIWVGGWYAGGKPIDPLPLLQAWAA